MRTLITILIAVTLAGSSALAQQGRIDDRSEEQTQAQLTPDPRYMFAQADETMGPPDRPRGRPGERGHMMRQRKYVEQFRLLKMLELLELNEDQELTFLTAYNSMRRELRKIDEERVQLIEKLAEGLRSEAISDSAIGDLTERIFKADELKRQVQTEFMQQASTTLTPQQFGRLVVFHERFERELLDRVRAFREHKGGR